MLLEQGELQMLFFQKRLCSLAVLLVFGMLLNSGAEEKSIREIKKMLNGNLGREATVVVFLGVSCPIANKYVPKLNSLSEEYEHEGVRFVGFNSNANETALEVAEHKREYEIRFDVYKDIGHQAADYFQAERTPEVFVLDAKGKIRYQGRIDDRHRYTGASTLSAKETDLQNALDELLAGKEISNPRTKALGCIIARDYDRPLEKITYSKQVSRIIQKRCQECHRPNAVAEFFPWMDYTDVKSMAGMIKEVIVDRRMPPWHADPRYGEFANDHSMPEEEINTIVTWIDAGCPNGDEENLPEPKEYPKSEWTIGQPDMVVKLPEPFEVPAQGVVDYKYYTVDMNIEQDVWVQRSQVVFDTPAVHHIILFYKPAGEEDARRHWVCGAAPGDKAFSYPEGMGRKVPAGSKFVFQVHYTPTGRKYVDQSYVGLVFSDEPVEHEVQLHPLGEKYLNITAGDPDFSYERTYHIKKDLYAITLFPHMHYRGKSFEYQVEYPDGKTETILSVPRYDFNWQSYYEFAEPKFIPAGSKIITIAHWDNSENNPYNPDPTKNVQYGEQSWDEMMYGFIDYYLAKGEPKKGPDIQPDPDNIPEEVRKKLQKKKQREARGESGNTETASE